MSGARVAHKCAFAEDVWKDFMAQDWDRKDAWDMPKLWMDGSKVFQLGKEALPVLRDCRNQCAAFQDSCVGRLFVGFSVEWVGQRVKEVS